MNRLLQANFTRLWKSKEFILSVIFMVLLAAFRLISVMQDPSNTLDGGMFIYVVVIGIVMAVFISLFVGVESSCCTLRNKLIVGHRRSQIYLANYLVCTLAGWLFCIAYLIPSLLIGIPLIGIFESEIWSIISTVLAGLLLTAVYSAIFVLLSMLISSRAIAAVISLITAIALFVAGISICSRLAEPEKNEIMNVVVGGEFQTREFVDNPLYLKGIKRSIYEFLNDFLPGGQAITLSAMFNDIGVPPKKIIFYDILLIFLSNSGGLIIFRKKNIK